MDAPIQLFCVLAKLTFFRLGCLESAIHLVAGFFFSSADYANPIIRIKNY